MKWYEVVLACVMGVMTLAVVLLPLFEIIRYVKDDDMRGGG